MTSSPVFDQTKISKVGPPFNFMGHMTQPQRDSFYAWMSARSGNFTNITTFYQIRAQQLRKAAGLLENYYANVSSSKQTPSFQKVTWQPQNQLHTPYTLPSDQIPAEYVSRMKAVYKEQLQVDEEAVFWMNWLRNNIEKQEDKAQIAHEANDTVKTYQGELNTCFNDPAYERVLISTDNMTNFRWNLYQKLTDFEYKIATGGSIPPTST